MLKSRVALQLENVALRHQIGVLQRSAKKRLRLNNSDRLLWIGLSRVWTEWRSALVIVKPETVIRWHRRAFRIFWTWKVQRGKRGCPGRISRGKYLVRSRKPPSQTWRTFLENHLQSLVSVDFFTVPTVGLQILYVFLVLAHEWRRIVHFAVTAYPTAEWTAHQLREAFPRESAPLYLLRDRDRIVGHEFVKQVEAMGIEEALSTPRSPWQRAYIVMDPIFWTGFLGGAAA